MPQAAVTLGLGALGGILTSKATNKATDASAKANADALAFERQKYEEEQALAKQQWEAQEAQRAPFRALQLAFARNIAGKYGINIPDMAKPIFPGTLPANAATGSPANMSNAMTLARLAGRNPVIPEPSAIEPSTPGLMAPPIMTLGDLGRRT